MMTRDALHAFWRNPDRDNQPVDYLQGAERSAFLVEIVSRHASPGHRILELGCNVGRNLAALAHAGFDDLAGVEINPEAVRILRASWPALESMPIVIRTIEHIVPAYRDDAFDLVYTMAVLEHLHPDSEWVFAEMARIARTIVTIEDEVGRTNRHCPRNYGVEFDALGLRQVETISCASVPGLGPDFMARVFVR